jgi:hypothetical protein
MSEKVSRQKVDIEVEIVMEETEKCRMSETKLHFLLFSSPLMILMSID